MRAGSTGEVRLNFRNNLAGGVYFLTAALADKNEHKYDLRFDMLEFKVEPTTELFIASAINLEVKPANISKTGGSSPLWRLLVGGMGAG